MNEEKSNASNDEKNLPPSMDPDQLMNVSKVSPSLEADTFTNKLAVGILQIFEPPLARARNLTKELIGRQNKIYIDLSAEKHKFDNSEIATLQEMMNSIKFYREKLVKIKKQMQSIYQRTKILKKRAENINACKQKELSRKLQKQQQEESLIGKKQQEQQQQQ